MNPQNLEMLERTLERLGSLVDEVVFVGGAAVDLWITDEAAPEFRLTEDIDVVVEIVALPDYYRLEERLREAGFENDQESGVICRFLYPDPRLVLDVMPTEASILGLPNEWLRRAFPNAVDFELPSGREIRVIPPPYLLATKLEAFGTRGEGDFYGSRDFGDVIVLIDGREELGAEMAAAPADLRRYVAEQFSELARHELFDNGVEGALPMSPETPERVAQVVRPRIERLAESRISIDEIRKQTGTKPMSRKDFDRHFGSLPTDGEG